MSNNYILENSKESVRLEKQSQLKQFSIDEEAKHLIFPKEVNLFLKIKILK